MVFTSTSSSAQHCKCLLHVMYNMQQEPREVAETVAIHITGLLYYRSNKDDCMLSQACRHACNHQHCKYQACTDGMCAFTGLSYYNTHVMSACTGLSYYTTYGMSVCTGLSYYTRHGMSALTGLSYYTVHGMSVFTGLRYYTTHGLCASQAFRATLYMECVLS